MNETLAGIIYIIGLSLIIIGFYVWGKNWGKKKR